jgi:hypothetical protein
MSGGASRARTGVMSHPKDRCGTAEDFLDSPRDLSDAGVVVIALPQSEARRDLFDPALAKAAALGG